VSRTRRPGVGVDVVLALLLAAAFAAIVFVATGGTDLAPNTWVQIALLALGAGSLIALTLQRTRPASSRPATVTVVLFAALAALTYLSIAWSVQPANSWVEANRTLSYLAAFAAAATLAHLAPRRWAAVLGAVGTVTVVVSGYALLAKVFPGSLDASDTLGRLQVPFGYFNATGLIAALGLPVCLWAGTRHATARVIRALTVPALAVLITALMLSYSRGTLVAAVLGVACWFVLVALRLRSALLLGLGAVFGALATAWALAHHAITHDFASLPARTAQGHTYGLVLLAVLVLSALAGLAATIAMDRVPVPAPVRRRIGTALVILLALVPVAAVAGAAASSRGLTGEISHVWSTLTSTTPAKGVGNQPGRLAALSNSRPLYWSEGLKVGEHNLLAGAGAGGFDTARTRYTTSTLAVAHAHSYAVETFADLGLIGVAVSLALLVAWAAAVRRALSGVPGNPAGHPGHPDERIGLIAMLAVVVTYGVSSLIDWTWFVPGVTVPALVCAGWLAGRGSRAEPRSEPAADTATARTTGRLPLGPAAAAIAILAVALIAGWFVWQPLHSSDQVTAAINAMTRGDAPAALADARAAATTNPVSVDPLWELAAIYSALREPTASRAELVKATQVQPSNAQTWQQLGSFDLQAHRVQLALAELHTALRLDRTSPLTRQLIEQAQSAQRSHTGSA
jgi:hypothetical protein